MAAENFNLGTELVKLSGCTLTELHLTFGKWLFIPKGEEICIEIVMAVKLSNTMSGDPIWIFVVGPPGCGKTETVRAFEACGDVYFLSSLTENALISGKQSKNFDPSLLPKLDGKTLVIKDFTTVLTARDEARRVIIGQLRDAFDGKASKAFGNIGTKEYKSRFSMVACVTPVIDKHYSIEQELGERFLKLRLHMTQEEKRKATRYALKNVGTEERMREELAHAVQGFLSTCQPVEEINVDDETLEKVLDLCHLAVQIRTHVSRHWKTGEVEYKPDSEVATRLGKQLLKLGMALTSVRGKQELMKDEYNAMVRIAIDTLPTKIWDFVLKLYSACPEGVATGDFGYGNETARAALDDLHLLGLVEKEPHPGKSTIWTLEEEVRETICRVIPQSFMVIDTPPVGEDMKGADTCEKGGENDPDAF